MSRCDLKPADIAALLPHRAAKGFLSWRGKREKKIRCGLHTSYTLVTHGLHRALRAKCEGGGRRGTVRGDENEEIEDSGMKDRVDRSRGWRPS